MTLLDRYLHAVRKHLPRNQRDDIVAELRDVLLSQIEAEEAARGRSLNDEDVGAILKRFGRPLIVAARYGSTNYLIGPTLYPAYLVSLKVLAWVAGPLAALSLLLTLVTGNDPFRQGALNLLVFTIIALANFAIITLVFARFERASVGGANADNWDPRTLPVPQQLEPTPRWHAVSSILMVLFYLLLWIAVLPVNAWIASLNAWFGGTPLPYGFAPVWSAVNPLIVGLMLTRVARDVITLIRPRWFAVREGLGLAQHAAALFVLAQLVRADAIFVVTDAAGQGAAHIGHFNQLFSILLFLATVGTCISMTLALMQRLRQPRRGAAHA